MDPYALVKNITPIFFFFVVGNIILQIQLLLAWGYMEI